MVQLGFAGLVAWLAFSVFDTHAGVTVVPKRWRDIGGMLVFVAVVELRASDRVEISPPATAAVAACSAAP